MSDSVHPHGLQPTRLLCSWDSSGKNAGVGCHALLQGIFLTQGSNPGLLCFLLWQEGSLPLAPPGKPRAKYIAYFFSDEVMEGQARSNQLTKSQGAKPEMGCRQKSEQEHFLGLPGTPEARILSQILFQVPCKAELSQTCLEQTELQPSLGHLSSLITESIRMSRACVLHFADEETEAPTKVTNSLSIDEGRTRLCRTLIS